MVSNVGLLRDSAQCQTSATPALALFGLGLNHDAEHALGLILRQPERLDGVLDREPVGDQSRHSRRLFMLIMVATCSS